ncbi:uncharacterized protein [Chelonus insularis]|uniref:uncharacterized protein n=1 Tax=Chelonus insularis TaxID=460826 RepID=UPI00158F282C|nr:uncharacterized protein LOC118063853 [Chelonus insularis]
MFKLFVFAAIVAVATATPGYLTSPLISTLIGEKTIESHGNSVVHASAPLVKTVAAAPIIETYTPVHYAPAAKIVYEAQPALLAEKTISSHGQSIVHNSAPVISAAYAAPVTVW